MTRLACLLTTAALAALPASAWSDQGHRLAARGAVKDLPPAVAMWFHPTMEARMADHASDPDTWKVTDPSERPRHHLECEPYGGPGNVPLDEDTARNQVGPDLFQASGQVPWTILARVVELTRAFSAQDEYEVVFQASILSHYVADLQVPLHTTTNHNGDDTGQHGVHKRWERGLVERIVERDGWIPEVRPAVLGPEPAKAPWAWLRQSHNLVAGLLRDDLDARLGPPEKGQAQQDAYWTAFMELQGPHVKEQLNLAAQRTAEMILYAWTRAGKPRPPVSYPTGSAQPSR